MNEEDSDISDYHILSNIKSQESQDAPLRSPMHSGVLLNTWYHTSDEWEAARVRRTVRHSSIPCRVIKWSTTRFIREANRETVAPFIPTSIHHTKNNKNTYTHPSQKR